MNFSWTYSHSPVSKPLTPTQKALLAEIKASGARVFDASKWNMRTITGLWTAGLIYWNCGPDSDYKQIALIVHETVIETESAPVTVAAHKIDSNTPAQATIKVETPAIETPAEVVEAPKPLVKAEDVTLAHGDLYFLARVALTRGTTSANRVNPVLVEQSILTAGETKTLTQFGRDVVISNLWEETERLRTEVTRLKTQLAQR